MAWSQLSVNKPHLVYIILGGFTSIFMLVSLFIKEKLYIGEATVATICGVIFGPHAANLIDPTTWGNTDQITLEFSRIVLVVQCFAVGVELPKAYMERHWRSVTFLLVPVMTFGWLITSLFVWWMVPPLSWLDSLVVAACVTATDPVLASSVVGKGKFAKRVPKHLRDILSAESGCNDGMAFPFIYLSLYLVRYDLSAHEVVEHWFVLTILYECIFGAVFGVLVGYIARRAIKMCEGKGIIDRESFLVFYFVLALFCAGAGSMLGLDDLLVGFAAGVGFSNDGWFSEKTEESHVSNVIDLLLNLAYFVYFGTIIPWDQFNSAEHGLYAWRLTVIALLVIFFRRIPIMLACKPFIPDIKTWREALFAGHFGPIGVGAIFVAILARAELETDSTEPLSQLPPPGSKDYELIYVIWPIVSFLVMASILVHGSSIAVFTLGKRINTLTITLSYTQDNANGPAWMNRLPRIQSSNSRSISKTEKQDSSDSIDEKDLELGADQAGPVAVPKLLLRRQKEDEYEKDGSKPSSRRGSRSRKMKKRKNRDFDFGGPISESAIKPAKRDEMSTPVTGTPPERAGDIFDREFADEMSRETSPERGRRRTEKDEKRRMSRSRSESVEVEAYDEGEDLIIEDEEGNVVARHNIQNATPEEKMDLIEQAKDKIRNDRSGEFAKNKRHPHEKNEGEEIKEAVEQVGENSGENPGQSFMNWKYWTGFDKAAKTIGAEGSSKKPPPSAPERKRGPAHAYQFGNTIIVEDEDGEVIKTYTLPGTDRAGEARKWTLSDAQMRSGVRKMSTWVGLGRNEKTGQPELTGVSSGSGEMKEVAASRDPTADLIKFFESERQKERRKSSAQDNNNDDPDDGLRLVISRAEQYGLTGLHKNPDSTVATGSGRRLSTRDFLKQMQQMDHRQRLQHIEESDAPDKVKDELRRVAKNSDVEKALARPATQRSGTTVNMGGETTKRPELATRAQSDMPSRPQAKRTITSESLSSIKDQPDEEREVPIHDLRSTLARRTIGQSTAAEQRRTRLAAIKSEEEEEEDKPNTSTDEPETAAEKRRRLAALGIGGRQDSDSSSDSDSGPSVRRTAEEEDNASSSANAPARPRIQWGGESGREGGKGTSWGGSRKAPGLQKKKKRTET